MMKSFSRMETASLLSTAAAVAARPRSPHHAPALALLVLGALLLGAAAGPVGAASTRISDPDVPSFSDVSVTVSSQISPDGQYAVYAQDAATDGAFELWSVRLDNTTPPQRLTGPLTAGQAPSFEISSGSPARVVYRVDQETPGKLELYSVLIAGGARTKLNPNMASNRDVYSFRLSPTGDRVFFTSDLEIYERGQLYSVPIAGGTAVRLNADLVFDFDIGNYQVSPDGGTVVYTDFRNASGERELWSVPALGPMESAVKINRSLNGGAVEDYYKISDDSDTVVYSANATASQRSDLYSVPIHGGTSTLLNTGSVSSHSVEPTFLISSDDLNPRVVFRSAPLSSAVYQLYSVPLGGGAVNRLNGSLGSGEAVATGFDISPDGNWVVYRSDEGTDNIYDLYSAPITGGTPIRLNEELEAYADVLGSPSFPDFQISPDSQRVVFLADQSIDTVNDLWSAPITGGAATKLNRTLASGGDVQAFRISPDSNWVVYGADQDADTVDELYRVSITGGAAQYVNGPLVSGGDVTLTRLGVPAFQISAENSIDVLFTADEDFNDKIELYLAGAAEPPGPPTHVIAVPGHAQATVTFSAPSSDGSSPITGYSVTPNPATPGWQDSNAGSTSLSHVIMGLTNGLSYTFTVRATNAIGQGPASAPSNPVTPADDPPGDCAANATTLCLHGESFAVTVAWRDFLGRTGEGRATQLSNESGDFWFFGADSNEMIVKIVDGCANNGRYWVFWRALSNVEMDLTIRNTETHQTLTYHNPLGVRPNGHLDIDTIFHCDGAGPESEHFDTLTDLPAPGIPQLVQYQDPALIGPCLPAGDRAICLKSGRFRVEGTWHVGNPDRTGYAHMIQKNESSGYAWFFNSDNYELLFKAIDACAGYGRTWIFIAGLTNVEATFTITDTWTGAVYRQENGAAVDFPTNLDIDTSLTYCGPSPF